jgi:hypothetical protein
MFDNTKLKGKKQPDLDEKMNLKKIKSNQSGNTAKSLAVTCRLVPRLSQNCISKATLMTSFFALARANKQTRINMGDCESQDNE